MILLYIDEDSMRNALVRALRARELDVLTALDVGLTGRADEEHLEYATEQGRVLYSFNIKDFYHLHSVYMKEGKTHSGIILAQQQQYSIGEQMQRILRISAERTSVTMRNRVEFLSAW